MMYRDLRPVGLLAAVLALGLGAGCSFGPSAMESDRAGYNIAVQRSTSEQLLLNLVRLRYREPTQFLEIGSITASFSYSAGANFASTIPRGSPESHRVGGDLAYAERPTITFTPLQGEQFANRVMVEIDMNAFTLLFRNTWNIERLMRVAIERIGDLQNDPTAPAGPGEPKTSYDKFVELARIWRKLQARGDLFFLMTPAGDAVVLDSLPAEQVNPMTAIAAAKDGYRFCRSEDGKYELRKSGAASLVIRAAYADEEEADTADAYLGVRPKRDRAKDGRIVERIKLIRFSDPREGQVREQDVPEVPIQLRSLNGVLFYLAQGIETPTSHEKKGLVKAYRDALGRPVDRRRLTGELLAVRSGLLPPYQAFASVYYRGHWFYINDSDISSKDTFALLGIIFALQAGDVRSSQPMLTIPVSAQ